MMLTAADPIVDQWYRQHEKGQKFKVVAVEPDDSLIEVQYFDGAVAEFDQADWEQLGAQPIEAPEDWTGAMDDIEYDDVDNQITDMKDSDWAEGYREQRTESAVEQALASNGIRGADRIEVADDNDDVSR